MRVKLTNPNEDRDLIVQVRNVRGQDGERSTVGPGESIETEVDDLNQLSVQAGAPTEGSAAPAQSPAEIQIKPADETEAQKDDGLTDVDDDTLKALLADMAADNTVERTQTGKIEIGAINSKLDARGFRPIKAQRRDDLTAAGAGATS